MNLTQNAINLLSQSGWHTPNDVPAKAELTDATTVVRVIYRNKSAVAYYIAPRLPVDTTIDQAKLLQQLNSNFSLQEMRDVAFKLGLDHDSLAQENRNVMARELLSYLQRRKKLPDLLQLVQAERPLEAWAGLPVNNGQTLTVTRPNLAVVININQLALETTAVYLQQQQIEANYLLIANTPNYKLKFIETNALPEMKEIVSTGYTALGRLGLDTAKRHYFLACPTPLAFMFGCALGTVRERDIVYHYQDNAYHEVAPIVRTLRHAPTP